MSLIALRKSLAIIASLACFAVGQEAKFNPLQKVVTLVTEMKAQTERDGEEDTMAYEKYACWCTTTEKEKTDAIATATGKIEELTAFVSEAAAKEAELKTEIEGLIADIQDDEDALAEATAIREKEKAAFDAAEADMTETLDTLKKAIDVLKEVQLLQKNGGASSDVSQKVKNAAAALLQVKEAVKSRFPEFEDVMRRDLYDVLGTFDHGFLPKRTTVLQQQDPSGLSGAAAGSKSYNSRSGEIFGVLQEMFDEFTRDLKQASKEEAKAMEQFAKMKEAKEQEIAAATAQKKAKEAELADTIQKDAKAKRDMEKMEKAKAADEEFLANLKKDCAQEAQEYEERTKVRTEEIAALGEALKILTEDDARDVFGKTMSFIQVQVSIAQERRMDRAAERAMKRLVSVAKRHNNWALASLAVRTRLDAFTKVKEMMDKMTEELKAEQKEEDEKKASCEKALDETEDELKVKKQEESDLADKHQGIMNTLKTAEADIAKLKSEEESMEVSLKQAGETRKAENGVFQQSISDQRLTISILKKALTRLEAFYTPDKAVLAQVKVHRQQQEPGAAVALAPPKPKDYEKNAGAGGVLQLFAEIITDAETVEIEIKKAEQDAQASYGQFTKDTTASIQATREAIAGLEKDLAEAEGAKSETEEAQLVNGQAVASLTGLLQAHHTDCDWLLKYFDVRKQARAEELDAISDAKAILSGADFGKEPPAEAPAEA